MSLRLPDGRIGENPPETSTLSLQKSTVSSAACFCPAHISEIDAKGRINLDKNLIDTLFARECVIIGVGERLELWDKQEWERYYDERRHL